MHLDGRSGRLSMPKDELLALTPCRTPAELDHALAELSNTKTADVTLRNNNVTVVNRRMNRESKEREATRLRVSRHRGVENVTEVKRRIRHKSDPDPDPKPDPKRLNDERLSEAKAEKTANGKDVNRSSLNRCEEQGMMAELRLLLGEDEMARAGGHWRVDHVRKHPDLTERAMREIESMVKKGEITTNPAAALEDLIKRWSR